MIDVKMHCLMHQFFLVAIRIIFWIAALRLPFAYTSVCLQSNRTAVGFTSCQYFALDSFRILDAGMSASQSRSTDAAGWAALLPFAVVVMWEQIRLEQQTWLRNAACLRLAERSMHCC